MLPELSPSTQLLIRAAYGVLMLATLAQALPQAARFFGSERWGGYTKSSPFVDAFQRPGVLWLVLATWIASAAAMVAGWGGPWPALINFVFCRYFFIHLRWKGVLRGMGAPGFLAYWLGAVVLALELTSRFAPELRSLAVFVAQIDMALIILSAGIYKVTAGYPRNEGMELGLCNPMWGYWWRQYVKLPPGHPVFWTLNYQAWGTEVVAAILMLIPATRELGGLLLMISFAFILTQIRLGFLCEMVMVAGLVYLPAGGRIDAWLASVMPPASTMAVEPTSRAVAAAIATVLWGYLALLPLAHIGLYYNFYGRRRLPWGLQPLLERGTNLFGIIIWRVFTVDLVNFFIRIHAEPRDGGERTLVGQPGTGLRFTHVGEMICLTSLFTTLKYYPSNQALFHERMLRYAPTVARPAGTVLVFEYVSVVKDKTRFTWVPAAEYRVDPEGSTVSERLLSANASVRAPHPVSPVYEGNVPGSYAPARR